MYFQKLNSLATLVDYGKIKAKQQTDLELLSHFNKYTGTNFLCLFNKP